MRASPPCLTQPTPCHRRVHFSQALIRPGRFDRLVTVGLPDRQGRAAILRVHARNIATSATPTELDAIAETADGFSGADLANIVNEAAMLAVRAGAATVTPAHLRAGVARHVAGFAC